MGLKLQQAASNRAIALDAYGRFERVAGQKDGPIIADFSWWYDQDAASERIPTFKEETITISAQEIADNPDLANAYNSLVTEIYKYAKAVNFPDAVDVI